ncbi:hypothetical protein SAMN05192573_10779 [Mucilaginibacter gossypii]|uniref:Uncharacterized protein n=1 Tax=Mucilaginibacter gossypii TaxID=551996 RepID=A0A1G8A3A4_9SPHI|nr:hypothetical protein SAMN05192573_10779 [Mucilaginibacter gossypii]
MESVTFLPKLPASNYRACEAANNAATDIDFARYLR